MKYLRCRYPVDILICPVCFDQFFVTSHRRKHSKLNLRIISISKDKSFSRYEHFPYLPAKFRTHRYILKIRFCRTDTPRRCYRLIKSRMDTILISYEIHKSVGIRRLKFRVCAIFKYIFYYRIIRCKLIKNIGGS